MKVQYTGESFGVDSLTDGNIYEVLGVEYGLLRLIDDSGEDYLYSAKKPGTIAGPFKGGRFDIIEDDVDQTLKKVIG